MNKMMRAVIAALLMACVLFAQTGIAEEPMTISEVVAASLPDEYAEQLGILEEMITQEYEDESIETPTAAPTAVPLPTETPLEQETQYDISFVLPTAWTNVTKGMVTIQIADLSGAGVQRVEYGFGGNWNDITTDYFMSHNGNIDISVTDNGTLTVRITDPHGQTVEESIEVKVFDRTEPSLQAEITGENLHIQAGDRESGVAGIQVNGLLFTTVENGLLDIRIPDILSKYKHLAVRAFDYAGNFSSPVSMENPFYKEPTSAPQTTPSATQSAQTTDVPETPTQWPADPTVTGFPYPTAADPTPQIIYVQPEATPTPVVETEYITIGPGMPYLADGNGHTLDVLYSAATNKQFITMQTKSGNVFYLVIDYDKPIDEDAEMYETYFLNLVDERDLLSLMSEDEMPTATPQVIYVTPEPTVQPAATPVPTSAPVATEPPAEKPEKNQTTGILALVLIVAAIGGAAFYFLKVKGKGGSSKPSSSYDLDDDDDEDEEEDKGTDE